MRLYILLAAVTLSCAVIATVWFNAVVGAFVYASIMLIALVWWEWNDRKQANRSRARDVLSERLAVRIHEQLIQTLATSDFTILSLTEWPAEQMAEWPEIPGVLAPLMAWDISIHVGDGSRGIERLTLYIDASLYVLAAVDLDECELVQEVSHE